MYGYSCFTKGAKYITSEGLSGNYEQPHSRGENQLDSEGVEGF